MHTHFTISPNSKKAYAFGSGVKERTASFTKKYHYAWNGKESENELFEGCLAFEARIYDSRIARWMSTDPREAEYAWQSTYVYFSNSPISVIDFLGMGATTENEPASTDDPPTRSDNTPLCSLPIFELATEPCSQKNINSDLYWNNPNVDDPTAMQKAWKIDPLITYQSIQGPFTGDYTNIDFYSVRIDKMPIKTDKTVYTPEELFKLFRTNLIDYVNKTGNTTLEYYNNNIDIKSMWESDNYNGSLFTFNMNKGPINLDDGTVMAYNVSNLNFTFGTMTSTFDREHPVAGNRKFGIQSTCTGDDCYYEIYIRGIDKTYGLQNIATTEEFVFQAAEELWRSVINNVVSDINKMGGTATVGNSEAYRCK